MPASLSALAQNGFQISSCWGHQQESCLVRPKLSSFVSWLLCVSIITLRIFAKKFIFPICATGVTRSIIEHP